MKKFSEKINWKPDKRICPACGQPEIEKGAPCGCTSEEKEKAAREKIAREAENAPPYFLPKDIK